jgi:hypothetical protein
MHKVGMSPLCAIVYKITACSHQHALKVNWFLRGDCVDECPPSYYEAFDRFTGPICQPCEPLCESYLQRIYVIDALQTISCNSKCQNCGGCCKVCVDRKNCLECADGFQLSGGKCYTMRIWWVHFRWVGVISATDCATVHRSYSIWLLEMQIPCDQREWWMCEVRIARGFFT